MIRKLILPAVAIALLGGCMTGGYNYRQDRGDYYYGQPGVDYRYHGSPYGYSSPYGYGYPGYWRYPYYGYGGFGYYRNPYHPYPGYPHYPYRPRPPVVVNPPPPSDGTPPPRNDDDRRPPWRDFGNLGRRGQGEPPRSQPSPMVQMPAPRSQPSPVVRMPAPPPRPVSRSSGSRGEAVMRRVREESRGRQDE